MAFKLRNQSPLYQDKNKPTLYDKGSDKVYKKVYGLEERVDKALGYPETRAQSIADDYTARNKGDDMKADKVRHAAASMYTRQAISKKLGGGILGNIAGGIGANVLGAAHEVASFNSENGIINGLQEMAMDMTNNAIGSISKKKNVVSNIEKYGTSGIGDKTKKDMLKRKASPLFQDKDPMSKFQSTDKSKNMQRSLESSNKTVTNAKANKKQISIGNKLSQDWKNENPIIKATVQLADPTGGTSYPDVNEAWNDNRLDYKDVTEPLGALPVIGKIPKLIKSGFRLAKSLSAVEKVAKAANKVNKVTSKVNAASKASNVEKLGETLVTPIKQTYKEDTSRFKNFDSKNDTLIKGQSRDLSMSRKIMTFNARNMSGESKDEKTFKEDNGSYSTMRSYKKEPVAKQIKSPLLKQKLSPKAAKAKAVRDLAFAKTDDRRAKKAHAQRKHRADPSGKGKDWDHEDQQWETAKRNRGNDGNGTKSESGKKYSTK